MNVAELIAALQKLPPEAEVYMTECIPEGNDYCLNECTPEPTLADDGRVWLYGSLK